MHAAIIDELEVAKPSFFNYQPHQGKTIFTMVNHFANRTRFYDIDWSAAIKGIAPAWVKDVPIIGKFFGGGDDKPAEDDKKSKELETEIAKALT